MKKDELKQKLLQTFILGYEGVTPSENLLNLAKNGLGGIIFFAENLKVRTDFKIFIKKFKKSAKIPLFFCLDQEGGLVERTIFLDKKNEYISPKALSCLTKKDIKKHYELLSADLNDLGINFNFAPLFDVNTNPYNPVIGIRSFDENPQTVIENATITAKTFKKNHIINCAKHFAGHGGTSVDSHITMPCVSMDYENFYKNHLVCFENAIQKGINSIMVSHVHFPFFDEIKTPASLSKNAVSIYLKGILKFKGLIVTDDMVMGGITKYYGLKESIVLALKAGVDMLIFKNISQEFLQAVDEIAKQATEDDELQTQILNAYDKILKFKGENLKEFCPLPFNIEENQKILDSLAKKTIKVHKNSALIPLPKDKKTVVVSYNSKEIYNCANEQKLSDFLIGYDVTDINYPIDPEERDLQNILKLINEDDIIIFLSYNAHLHDGQLQLFKNINAKKILVSCALDYDINLFYSAEAIISLCNPKTPSIKGLAEILTKN